VTLWFEPWETTVEADDADAALDRALEMQEVGIESYDLVELEPEGNAVSHEPLIRHPWTNAPPYEQKQA
jgi:hypothetical protein